MSQPATDSDRYGLGRGQVFPASRASSLLNPLRRLVQSASRTVAVMDLAPDAVVMEVGPGPGFFSPSIAARVPEGCLALVDLQLEMVQQAQQRLAPRANIVFLSGDATALPVAAGRIDAILLATMLGEVPDPAACLAEVRRVLRPRGCVTVAETRRDSDFMPLGSVVALAAEQALTLVERRGVRWQYVARFQAA